MIFQMPVYIGDNFGEGIKAFLKIVNQLNSMPETEPLVLDFTCCRHLKPSFLLPIMLLLNKETKRRDVSVKNDGDNLSFRNYLEVVYFGEGFKPEMFDKIDYELALRKYVNCTYIPLVNFPATAGSSNIRDNFLEVLNTLLTKQLELKGPFHTGIMYLLHEAINNIVDHSQEQRGYLFAQYYPARAFIDICIADSGISVLGSYQGKSKEIETDKDAIRAASIGESSKHIDGETSRGFGIRTSKRMLAEGLRGKYFLLSGNAFLLKDFEREEIVEIPSTYH